MKKRQEIIKDRLVQRFKPNFLEVIDESDQHVGHAGHQGGERHFSIVISAPELQNLSRINAHQNIYALFADMIPDKIHALKIKIIPAS